MFISLLDKLKAIITLETVDSMIFYCRHKTLPALNGAMSSFMNIYLDMVNMLLNFLQFLRVGNWEGYLVKISEFLPYCFSLNQHNYAQSLSYYYIYISLKEGNLEAFQYLHGGGFTGFISMDRIIEITRNR